MISAIYERAYILLRSLHKLQPILSDTFRRLAAACVCICRLRVLMAGSDEELKGSCRHRPAQRASFHGKAVSYGTVFRFCGMRISVSVLLFLWNAISYGM